MYTMFSLSLMIFMIPLLMLMINMIISKKNLMNYEKMSPFECGFDPLSHSRLPFSIQFFLISIIFLIFDTEIMLLIPLIIMTSTPNKLIILLTLMFMFILLYGLYIEYLENSIEWKK